MSLSSLARDGTKDSLRAATKKSPAAGEVGDGTLRMAALKLILAIVAMSAGEGDNDSPLPPCLESGQLTEILSVVKKLSNHDPDNDIRALASQVSVYQNNHKLQIE